MRIRLSPERRAGLLQAIKESFAAEFDEPSAISAPTACSTSSSASSVHRLHGGVRDASSYMQQKLADIEGEVAGNRRGEGAVHDDPADPGPVVHSADRFCGHRRGNLDGPRCGQAWKNWFAWSVAVAATGVAFPAWLIARRRFEPSAGRHDGTFSAALVAGILFVVTLDFC